MLLAALAALVIETATTAKTPTVAVSRLRAVQRPPNLLHHYLSSAVGLGRTRKRTSRHTYCNSPGTERREEYYRCGDFAHLCEIDRLRVSPRLPYPLRKVPAQLSNRQRVFECGALMRSTSVRFTC